MTARTRRRPSVKRGRTRASSTSSSAAGDVDTALLESLVGYNLRRAAARQRERFRSVFEPFDLRPVQLTALTLILHNEPIRQAELGNALEMKRANVVTLLDELQNRALLSRTLAPDDRRSYELRLTDEGRRFTREMLSIHARLEADLAHSLGQTELRQLVRLLTKVRKVSPAPDLG